MGKITTEELGNNTITSEKLARSLDIAALTIASKSVATGTQASHIPDQAAFSSSTDTDTAAHLKTCLDLQATKINTIIAALEAFGITASA